MNQNPSAASSLFITLSSHIAGCKRSPLWIVATLLLTVCLAQAGPDDDYIYINGAFRHADQLAAQGETNQAHEYYLKAQRELQVFQQANPNWNREIVNFRLKYLADKVAATSEKPAAPTSESSTSAQTTTAPAKSPVKLIATGKEPLTLLRLHPQVGDKQTLNMTMKMAMDISAAGQHIPSVNIPAMTMAMTVEVKELAANGDIHYEMTFDDVSLSEDTNTLPAVAAAMKASLDSIRGMTATGTMTSQGVVKAMRVKMPAGTAPQMSQMMNQMKESFSSSYIPFPNDPIGPGAKWEYTTKIKNQGMTIEQTSTYELVSVDGDAVTLNTAISQTAAHQQIQNPAMPGMKMELTKLTGSGTGKTTFDLAHITPQSSSLAESTDMAMGMNMGQQKQEMTMKMDISVSMETN